MNQSDKAYHLRQFAPEQWPLFRSIRLEALQEDPGVFGSTYAREAAFSDEEWQQRLLNPDAAMFALFYYNDCIGLTGILIPKDTPATALCVASYIRSAHRGQGLSALFYKARIGWARHKGCRCIEVSHRRSNTASRAANQKAGFFYSHTLLSTWPDGVREENDYYRLDL